MNSIYKFLKNKRFEKKYFVIILVFLAISCKKREESNSKRNVKKISDADLELIGNEEKIALLAIAKGMNYDSLYSILKDYYTNVGDSTDALSYTKAVMVTSQKYSISNRLVAKIVFSYKYEMLSKEEIVSESERESDIEQRDYQGYLENQAENR